MSVKCTTYLRLALAVMPITYVHKMLRLLRAAKHGAEILTIRRAKIQLMALDKHA